MAAEFHFWYACSLPSTMILLSFSISLSSFTNFQLVCAFRKGITKFTDLERVPGCSRTKMYLVLGRTIQIAEWRVGW